MLHDTYGKVWLQRILQHYSTFGDLIEQFPLEKRCHTHLQPPPPFPLRMVHFINKGDKFRRRPVTTSPVLINTDLSRLPISESRPPKMSYSSGLGSPQRIRAALRQADRDKEKTDRKTKVNGNGRPHILQIETRFFKCSNLKNNITLISWVYNFISLCEQNICFSNSIKTIFANRKASHEK